MKTIEDLTLLFKEQQGMTQDTLNAYSSDSVKDFSDRDEYVEMFKERLDVITTLIEVFSNYKKYEQEGLPRELDIEQLEYLKGYCILEKERLTNKVYENMQIENKFYDAFQDSEVLGYWQDAELYLLRLISLNSN